LLDTSPPPQPVRVLKVKMSIRIFSISCGFSLSIHLSLVPSCAARATLTLSHATFKDGLVREIVDGESAEQKAAAHFSDKSFLTSAS
jgi:hypothetical protein